MSIGISPKLPLVLDTQDGTKLNKTLNEAVKQNLKMLVLTVPGERLMDPDFGVGLSRYLFEPNINLIWGEIESTIRQQVTIYLPFVEIEDIDFGADEAIFEHHGKNLLSISLQYRIVPLSVSDILELVV